MANGSHPKKSDGSFCAPSRVPQSTITQEAKEKGTTYRGNEEDCAKLAQIEARQKEKTEEQWKPVQGAFPRLVFQTHNRMDTFYNPKNKHSDCPGDMRFSDEDKEDIEKYGWHKPFNEEEFTLSAGVHFDRMRELGDGIGFSMLGKTKDIFSKMVDKFQRNEGGYYMHPLLDDSLRDHPTTANFHKALKKCLAENIKEGVLDKNILSLSSSYMATKGKGASLPHFEIKSGGKPSMDVINGTVLTVHGIWSMRVVANKLEYKGNQVRGQFSYHVQDHFGLNSEDINHHSISPKDLPFEQLSGFRSWYLLQHYKGYGYQPFITQFRFKL